MRPMHDATTMRWRGRALVRTDNQDPQRSEWTARAACRGHVAEFFPEPTEAGTGTTGSYDTARAICADCPVAVECLAEADAIERTGRRHGMRAVLTPNERRKRSRELTLRQCPDQGLCVLAPVGCQPIAAPPAAPALRSTGASRVEVPHFSADSGRAATCSRSGAVSRRSPARSRGAHHLPGVQPVRRVTLTEPTPRCVSFASPRLVSRTGTTEAHLRRRRVAGTR